ncbi:nitroreductase/quinone reductase family protein [Pseudonocardia lacus]|uniref:nitroreductase/quinone reductase family protein n=1 Tax=Pseudonocardia lacus TaxID=2835865 RepID=UPI001BDD6843|nr:nitroreductase/quinone reductase family protein [Pseudonocardia lacus]
MRSGPAVERVVNCVNAGVTGLAGSRLLGPAVRRTITTATYTGRRSGRTFSTPVGYRRSGDVVTIIVEMPDRKNWWRNFTGEGGPLTLALDGGDRTGHAVARRDGRRVRITVELA